MSRSSRALLLLAAPVLGLALARAQRPDAPAELVVLMGRAALDGGGEAILVDGAVLPGGGGPLSGMGGDVTNASARELQGLAFTLRNAPAEDEPARRVEADPPSAGSVRLGERSQGFTRIATGVRAVFADFTLEGGTVADYHVRAVSNPGGRDVELVLTPAYRAAVGETRVTAHLAEPVLLAAPAAPSAVRAIEEPWLGAVIVDVAVGATEEPIAELAGSVQVEGDPAARLAALDVVRADGSPLAAEVALDGDRFAVRPRAPLAQDDRLTLVARLADAPAGAALSISVRIEAP